MTSTLKQTNFTFPGQKSVYYGKEHDIYNINNDILVVIATDRVSVFGISLLEGIPYKGQVLNQIAEEFFDETADIVPNWKIASPDPNVTIGWKCKKQIQMGVYGYLTGYVFREYKLGRRIVCGVPIPKGMVENQKFLEPIITPRIKSSFGVYEYISHEEIIQNGFFNEEEYQILEDYTRKLFLRCSRMADDRGFVLDNAKYEFGKREHFYLTSNNPVNSYYWQKDESSVELKNIYDDLENYFSKNGFQGKKGEMVPVMGKDLILDFSGRYIDFYEKITGKRFQKYPTGNIISRIEDSTINYLDMLHRVRNFDG